MPSKITREVIPNRRDSQTEHFTRKFAIYLTCSSLQSGHVLDKTFTNVTFNMRIIFFQPSSQNKEHGVSVIDTKDWQVSYRHHKLRISQDVYFAEKSQIQDGARSLLSNIRTFWDCATRSRKFHQVRFLSREKRSLTCCFGANFGTFCSKKNRNAFSNLLTQRNNKNVCGTI